MPEGPELYVAGLFAQKIGEKYIFGGKVEKSAVSLKNPDVDWNHETYGISATSRGKEVMITLTALPNTLNRQAKENVKKVKPKRKRPTDTNNGQQKLTILFRFGMSGKFQFVPKEQMHKHAHLNFFTKDGKNVFSFVDYRRFGKWEVNGTWGKERGPCVLQEYELFRSNVLKHLKSPVFDKPICEVLLNQKYFNGIGNYLRAEILYRLGIPPFAIARSVIEPIKENTEKNIKSENQDILQLCNRLPQEVICLNNGKGHLYDPEDDAEGFDAFLSWLRCYYKDGMQNLVDHNGRTIWFTGNAGPLVPKEKKSRGKINRSKTPKKKSHKVEIDSNDDDAEKHTIPVKIQQLKGDTSISLVYSPVKTRAARRKLATSEIKCEINDIKYNEPELDSSHPKRKRYSTKSKRKLADSY